MNRSLSNNIRTIYLIGFCQSFMVVIPIFVPLLQGHGLSMSQVLQTQALFALTIALFEVPSGYLADIWGRRPAMLVGSALNAVGFASLLWADSFADFLLYEVILGVGFSLLSGTDLALLYDTEVHLQEKGLPGGAGTGKSLSRLISIEAAASGIAGIAASILLLFGKPVVDWTAFAITVFGLLAIYVFWVYQKYWELQQVPLASFGYIWAAFALTVSLAARFSADLEARLGSGWLGVMFGFCIQLSRGLSVSLFYEALNSRVPGAEVVAAG